MRNLFIKITATLFLCIASWTALSSAFDSEGFPFKPNFSAPLQRPLKITQATHILGLRRKDGISRSASFLHSSRKGIESEAMSSVASLTPTLRGQVFVTDITVGSQTFQAAVDTGSSDTWLIGTDFQCVNVTTRVDESQDRCAFGPTYNASPTFKQIQGQNFNVTYGSGEFLTGIVGREMVTFAGITVKDQEIALVDSAAWHGDGISSGLIGLAFAPMTRAYAGTDPTRDVAQIEYSPLFTTMYSQGYTQPVFSLAIDRSSGGSGGGQLAIGGLPSGYDDISFTSTPLQLLTMNNSHDLISTSQYYSYIISTNGFTYAASNNTHSRLSRSTTANGSPSNSSRVNFIIDSGTTFIFAPTGIANAANAAFDPPAVFDSAREIYIVDCSAKPPEFGVGIDSEIFFINSADMILSTANGDCMSGINDAGNSSPILGDVFLKNVLAVFDIGASEMRFAAR